MSPSVMTGSLMSSFGIEAGVLGNLIAYYYYIYTPMQLPVGVLMDRYGPRRLLVFACLLCVIGSFWFASALHPSELAGSRLLTGMGSAFAFVGVMKLASSWLPENRFALAAGLTTTLGTIGGMVGDDVISRLISYHGWRNSILDFAYIGFILAIVIFFLMRDKPTVPVQQPRPMMSQMTFRKLWPEIKILVLNPLVWLVGVVGLFTYLPASAFAELWGVPFLKTAYGLNREAAAHAISFVFFGLAIGNPLIGWISDKIRRRRLPLIIGAIFAAIIGFALVYVPNLSKTELCSLLFLFGVFSSVETLVFAIGREISPSEVSGTAIAFINMLVMVGGVIFQPLIGYMLDMKWDGTKLHNVPVYTLSNYHFALFAVPAGFIVALALLFVIPETHADVKHVKG
ncbi:MAG: MFS transporter [Gammaproteobacteria bacterium]|nr:MFS transporter [Gammaproteobacteria bacterium]